MVSNRVGTYRIRVVGETRERMLHAPQDAEIGMRYDLYVESDGSLRYIPVK